MPIVNGVKKIVLYLEGFQMRMIKDFLGVECDTYELDVPATPHPTMRYGIPTDDKCKRMYFTGWQKREIKDEAGVDCEFIELCKDQIVALYMVRHPVQKS
ncbi:MAG: hypothetical protein WB930_19260 [Syntrophobacteraceae bacterium]